MLRNNIELDLKTRFAEEGITQTEVAEKLGVSPPYVNRMLSALWRWRSGHRKQITANSCLSGCR